MVEATEVADTKKQPSINKQPFLERALRKPLSPERATELLSAQILIGLENLHDINLVPEHYGMTREQVGKLFVPDNPAVNWAINNIGDIWEISVGFTAMRLGFVAVNEVLKKSKGKEIPDEACFWASLMTTWTIKAAHSMGWISLMHIHDHMGHPVPGMIFGQGVAAVVLAASHYAAKYREPIKELALRVGTKVVEGAKSF